MVVVVVVMPWRSVCWWRNTREERRGYERREDILGQVNWLGRVEIESVVTG